MSGGSRSRRSPHRRREGEDRAPEERTWAAATLTHQENPIRVVRRQFSVLCLMASVFVVCCVTCQRNRLPSVRREIKLHTVSHLRVGGPQWSLSLRWWGRSPRSTGWTQGLDQENGGRPSAQTERWENLFSYLCEDVVTFSLSKHSLCVSVLSSHDARTRSQFPGSEVPQAEAGLPASRGPLQGPPVPCDGPVALL